MLASNWNHTPHTLPPSHLSLPTLTPLCVLSTVFFVFCFVLLFFVLIFCEFLHLICTHKFIAVSLFLLCFSLYSYCCICRISVVAQIPLSSPGPDRTRASFVLSLSVSLSLHLHLPPTNNEFLLWSLTSNWLNFIYFICNARNISVAVFSLAATGHQHKGCRGGWRVRTTRATVKLES